MSAAAPQLALLGAFHFPVPQGSQVYVAEQARALVAAGARVTLLCYGGRAPADEPFELVSTPAWCAPGSHRAGPRLHKPLADLALLRALRAAHRARRFDAVLAHNAEAALLALQVRRSLGVPVLYVAHTLLGEELHVYAPAALEGFARSLGRALDRSIARRADASIALSRRAREVLAQWSPAPVALIPPGLAPRTAPSAQEVAVVCAAHALEAGRFALYTGNLDAYQDVEALIAAAALVPELPVVLASHDAAPQLPGVRVLPGCSPETARSLSFGARMALCPRRTCAGFPIKLLNYMEAGRAILAREGAAGSLQHGRDAWLVPGEAGARAFAEGMRALHGDDELRAALGSAARKSLTARHAWPGLAADTLALVESARSGAARR